MASPLDMSLQYRNLQIRRRVIMAGTFGRRTTWFLFEFSNCHLVNSMCTSLPFWAGLPLCLRLGLLVPNLSFCSTPPTTVPLIAALFSRVESCYYLSFFQPSGTLPLLRAPGSLFSTAPANFSPALSFSLTHPLASIVPISPLLD